MTRRTRKILFLFLLILFLIAAPLTVFYSLGWRCDWKTKKVIQPGVFYFKVWPRSVEVYLDGGLKGKTDFFFGSVLVENLLSKKYDVEIKKQGFHSWKKTLEIKKREVTEAKNIVLIPQNPNFTVLTKEIEELLFSPDKEKIILKEVSNKDSKSPGWALKLFEIDKKFKSHLIDETDISKEKVRPVKSSKAGAEQFNRVKLFDLKFSPDSNKILLELGLKEKVNYYLLEINKVPALLTSLDFLNSDVKKVYFHPKNHQKLLVLLALTSETGEETRTLSEVDLIDKKISPPVLENLITCSIFNEGIYYLDASGFLFKTDLSFNQKERLNIIPFSLKEETEYEIKSSNSHVFLEENDIIYIFDETKKSFEKFFESIKDLKFSPDSRKMAYFNNYEIWILFLEKKYDQSQKEAGEKLFITRFSEKIDEVFWYTNHYLIFTAGDKIKMAEIDDRDKINIVDLAEFKEPKIFWSNKKLYILSEENLYVSEELTP